MLQRSIVRTVLLALLLGGCTLIDPHVSAPLHSGVPEGLAGEMTPALQDGEAMRDAYFGAVGQASVIRNGFGLALIPLGAAALAVSVTGSGAVTQEILAATGAAGGALVAGSLFAPSTDRQRVWLAGSEAVGCAVLALRPLTMTLLDEAVLRQDLRTLASAIAQAEAAFDTSDEREATALSRARRVLAAALRLDADVNGAGLLLEMRLRDIRDRVSEQVLRTEPDTNAILAAAGRVRHGGAGFGLTTLPGPAGSGPGVKAGIGQNHNTALLSLSEATTTVALWLGSRQLSGLDQHLAQCVPNETDATAALTVQPDVINLVRGASQDLPLHAGDPPLVTLSGPNGVTAQGYRRRRARRPATATWCCRITPGMRCSVSSGM